MTVPTTTGDRAREQRAAWIVWGALVAVTLAGWLLADGGGAGTGAIALVVALGAAKCWLIVQNFMEVRHAPRWLQVATTGWIAVLWVTLLVLFLEA